MALGIYTAEDVSTLISNSGTRTNPLNLSIDGRKGGEKEILLYLKADDLSTYSNVTITPILSSNGENLITGDTYYWKLCAGLTRPSSDTWYNIDKANTLTMDDIIADDAVYHPFWLKIVVPFMAPTRTVSHLSLRVSSS